MSASGPPWGVLRPPASSIPCTPPPSGSATVAANSRGPGEAASGSVRSWRHAPPCGADPANYRYALARQGSNP
eukprot:216175-Prorocentrum_minimum.AAC.1